MTQAIPIQMPKLTMAAIECTFVQWLVDDGAQVRENQPLYVVATEKVESEVDAPASGVLHHGDVAPQVDYPVGTVVGTIETD